MNEENPIIQEIRQTRDKIVAEHGNDVDSFISDLQRLSEGRARAGQSTVSPASHIDTPPTKKVG